MPYRNLGQTETNIKAAGLDDIIIWLLSGGDDSLYCGTQVRSFYTRKQATRARRLIYEWLWFYPDIKGRVSMKLDSTETILTVQFKLSTERRGRKGLRT